MTYLEELTESIEGLRERLKKETEKRDQLAQRKAEMIVAGILSTDRCGFDNYGNYYIDRMVKAGLIAGVIRESTAREDAIKVLKKAKEKGLSPYRLQEFVLTDEVKELLGGGK